MIVRRIARPMLSSVFIWGGIDTLRNPGPRARLAEPVVDAIVDLVEPFAEEATGTREPLPTNTTAYVRANAAVQIGAGIMLASGRAPRLAATALAVSLVPTTLAGHRFWELDGAERQAQRIHFAKNVAMLGGLILAAVDTEGRADLVHRVRRERRTGAELARDAGHGAVALGGLAVARAAGAGNALADHRYDATDFAASHGHDLAQIGSDVAHAAAARVPVLASRGSEVAKDALAKGQDLLTTVGESDLRDKAADAISTMSARAQGLVQSLEAP